MLGLSSRNFVPSLTVFSSLALRMCRIYRVGAICHFTTFLGHLSNFLLPWYTLCVAADLFLRLHYAHKVKGICSSLKAKVGPVLFYVSHVDPQQLATTLKLRPCDTFARVLCARWKTYAVPLPHVLAFSSMALEPLFLIYDLSGNCMSEGQSYKIC